MNYLSLKLAIVDLLLQCTFRLMPFFAARTMTCLKLKRVELFDILQREKISLSFPNKCKEHLVNYAVRKYDLEEQLNSSPELEKTLDCTIDIFLRNLKSRWISSRRVKDKIIKKNNQWLQCDLNVHLSPNNGSRKRGRPRKLFSEGSIKTKNRDTFVANTVATTESCKLVYALRRTLHSQGKRKAAEVVGLASSASPRSLKRMKDAFSLPVEKFRPYSPEESLALMIDLNLSKEQL